MIGRTRREWTPAGAAFTDGANDGTKSNDVGDAIPYDRNYAYDRAGRLVKVEDRTATGAGDGAPDTQANSTVACVTRHYRFDKNDNRTSLVTTPAASDNSCSSSTTPSSTRTWNYDTADRSLTASGYTYDALGRTGTIPAIDTPSGAEDITLRYYDNDAARQITQNGQTVTYTLDPAGRRLEATTAPAAGGDALRTVVRHYGDNSDSPTWAEERLGSDANVVVRYAQSLDGQLAATIAGNTAELALTSPRGSVVSTVTLTPDAGCRGHGNRRLEGLLGVRRVIIGTPAE